MCVLVSVSVYIVGLIVYVIHMCAYVFHHCTLCILPIDQSGYSAESRDHRFQSPWLRQGRPGQRLECVVVPGLPFLLPPSFLPHCPQTAPENQPLPRVWLLHQQDPFDRCGIPVCPKSVSASSAIARTGSRGLSPFNVHSITPTTWNQFSYKAHCNDDSKINTQSCLCLFVSQQVKANPHKLWLQKSKQHRGIRLVDISSELGGANSI